MLMPNENGNYSCGNDKCKFESNDIFDYLRHTNTEYKWNIRISNSTTFDMFAFIETLDYHANRGDLDDVYDLIQSFSLMMVNASEGEFDEFLKESYLLDGTDEVIRELEKMLKDEKK